MEKSKRRKAALRQQCVARAAAKRSLDRSQAVGATRGRATNVVGCLASVESRRGDRRKWLAVSHVHAHAH
jgi:hypothetical protein